MRVGPHQGLDPGGDVGPLGARGDEPARRVGRRRAATGLQNGIVPRPGPRDCLQGGVDPGARTRIQPSVRLTRPAGSRSKPVSIDEAAASSSPVSTAPRVWGIVLAGRAITAASLASVWAAPGVRSAMRRIDSPGGRPAAAPMSRATATARDPMVAG